MQEDTSSVVITIHPETQMELVKFANAMAALNREYRRWLRENGKNPNNDDLKLYIQTIESGSIIVVLKDLLEKASPLIEFGKNFIDAVAKLMKSPKDTKGISADQARNIKNFMSNNKSVKKVEFSIIKNEKHIHGLQISGKDAAKLERALSDIKEKEEIEDAVIKFTRFDVKSTAKIIVEEVDGDEYTAVMKDEIRNSFWQKESDNIFKKDYLAHIEVKRRGNAENEVLSYVIKKIKGF